MTRTIYLTKGNVYSIGTWLRDYCWKLREIRSTVDNCKIFPEIMVDEGYDSNDLYIQFDIFDSNHYRNVHRVRIPVGARIEGLDITIVPESDIQPDNSIVGTTPDENWLLLTPPTTGEEVHFKWCEGMFELVIDSEAVKFYTEDPVHCHAYSSTHSMTLYRFQED